MNKERRRLPKNISAITGALSLLVVIAYMVNLGIAPPQIFQPNANNSAFNNNGIDTADRIGTDLLIKHFDSDGNISHQFTSGRAEYFTQLKPIGAVDEDDSFDDSSPLFSENDNKYKVIVKANKPSIKVFSEGRVIAQLNANSAVTDAANQHTELIGNVRLRDIDNDALLLTEKLLLLTESKQILTREDVEIVGLKSSTTSHGLQGNLTDQRWKLMSKVKSVIQP